MFYHAQSSWNADIVTVREVLNADAKIKSFLWVRLFTDKEKKNGTISGKRPPRITGQLYKIPKVSKSNVYILNLL